MLLAVVVPAFAQSLVIDELEYTVTLDKPVTINGEQYDGRAQVLRFVNVPSSLVFNIPASVSINSKNYAVTSIASKAFTESIRGTFQVTGCELVDSIFSDAFFGQTITSIKLPNIVYVGENAFKDCLLLTDFDFGPRLKNLDQYSLQNAPLRETMVLPLGLERFGARTFMNSNVKKLLVPTGTKSINAEAFYGMVNAEEYIINLQWAGNPYGMYFFDDVPATCKVLVPVGSLAQNFFITNPYWQKFNDITEGAFDFTPGSIADMDKSTVHIQVQNKNTPATVDGVNYAGKATYVYNAKNLNATEWVCKDYEVYEYFGTNTHYLMTEIGELCMAGNTNIKTLDLTPMKHLVKIGPQAFNGCDLKVVELSNVTPPSASTNTFSCYETATLVVPTEALAAYKKHSVWSKFAKITDEKPSVLKGDVNEDGFVDIVDVNEVINFILAPNPDSARWKNADVNGDNVVDVVDLNEVINIILS